ncbi:MAG: alpha/beta hydrolase [bacterium]
MPYADVNGTRLFYRDIGEGEPIVFLHCWATDSGFWKHQLEHFSKSHRCIAPDYFGHGKSDSGPSHRPEVFADHLHALLVKLRLARKKVIPVGHSLGGMVAMSYALKHPGEVKALVLVGSTPCLAGFPEQGIAALFAAPFVLLALPTLRGLGAAFTAMHPLAPPLKRIEMILHVRRPSNLSVTRTLIDFIRFNAVLKLRRIESPSLILNGSADVYTDIRHALLLRLLLKNSRLRLVNFSGHTAPFENPRDFNRMTEEFIASVG